MLNAHAPPTDVGPLPVRQGKYRYVRWRWRLLVACIDCAGEFVAAALRTLFGRRLPTPLDPSRVRSVLWVQLDHLGDAVLSTAVLPSLKRAFPHARLDVLAAPWNRDLFVSCSAVDAIYVSRRNRFSRSSRKGWVWSTLWWGWKLRSQRYDLAIDPRGELPIALLLWLAAARRRLGWSSGGGGFLLTDVAEYEQGRHEIASRQALLACVGVAPDEQLALGEPWLAPGEADRARVAELLPGSPRGSRPLVALHVGAGSRAKQWPVENWRELLGRLILEWNARVVLVGGADDRELADRLTMAKVWPGVIDLTGRLQILETAALLAGVDLFVGGDSGPAHLAAAVGAPVVSLFSGTNDSRQWRPWGRRVLVLRHEVACSPCHRETCPLRDHPCLVGLAPGTVLAAAERWLTSQRRGRAGAFAAIDAREPPARVTEATP